VADQTHQPPAVAAISAICGSYGRTRGVITFAEILRDKGYPGFDPVKHINAPWVSDQLSLFKPEDEARFWFKGFQWPRAYPLNFVWLEDGFAWGTQAAAHNMPLPPSDGLAPRVAGIFVYGSDIPVTPWIAGSRAERVGAMLPPFLQNFPAIWDERRAEIVKSLRYLETHDLAGKSAAEIWQFMVDARAFHVRAWEIHFDLMYPLTANYLGFYGLCKELGIAAADIPKFLQGYETQPMKSDRLMWQLANNARGTAVHKLIADAGPPGAYQALTSAPAAAGWLKDFDAFLQEYGWRSDSVVDVSSPAWVEDPNRCLGIIKSLLQSNDPYGFENSLKSAIAEREGLIERSRAKMTTQECGAFDQALASCQHANFAWWNDDHNWYVDMRCTLPIRKAAQAIARAVDFGDPDDVNFLFYSELSALANGKQTRKSFEPLIAERKAYFNEWNARLEDMPIVLGTPPETIADPVVIEIFGITNEFLERMKTGAGNAHQLSGVPASSGVARGIARVLRSPDELHRLQQGDVLVCVGTTPTWTPAFTKIAACVCDGGGTLTHASVVSREYRVPCVVGTGLATQTIKDGDEVTVDGDKGLVTVHRAA
jgi:phosphohistidine swiveling domain-containing protein